MRTLFAIVFATLLSLGVVASAGAETCSAPLSPKAKGADLSTKLEKCNGVLKPGKTADPDIVLPTPKVQDPMMVHPKDLPKGDGVAK